MLQNAPETIAPLRHQRGADLAQPDAVPPPGADQRERGGRAAVHSLAIDHKGRAVKVRRRERAADFKLLANDHRFALAHNAQTDDSPRSASLDGFELMNRAERDAELRPQQLPQLVLRYRHAPPVKISGLLIEIGQNLSEDDRVRRVAERGRRIANPALGVGLVGQRQVESGWKLFAVIRDGQVRKALVLPGRVVALGHPAARFCITRVAQLIVESENLPERSANRLVYPRRGRFRDALITLAMVVGADVEIGVALLVVPADQSFLA